MPRLLPLLPLLAAFSGCTFGLGPRTAAPIHYHALMAAVPEVPAGEPAPLTLAVRPFEAASRYRDRILYRSSGTAVGYHELERWADPPAEMVTETLLRALEAANAARVVAHERLLRRADVEVEGRVTRFDEVHGADGWAAECEFEILLKRGDRSGVLFATRLAARKPAESRTTAACVDAMNAAVAEVTTRAVAEVRRALKSVGAPKPQP